MPSVSGFGIRRVYRSTTALDPPPLATALTIMGSEILSNVVPENVVDRLSERHHGTQRDDRDQHRQQAVLEKVLTIVLFDEPSNCRQHVLHGFLLHRNIAAGPGGPAAIWSLLRAAQLRGDVAEDRIHAA